MEDNREKGRSGEDLAVAFLKDAGYRIKHRNWYAGKNEIDIVAENDKFVVFVEVKTRKSDYYAHPRDAVTIAKQRGIIFAASAYAKRFNVVKEARFDIITIITGTDPQELEHIEDAFYPTL